MGKYDDIINLPHYVSKKHPQMPRVDRAAQFSSFAALTGFDDAIDDAGRPVFTRAELGEDDLIRLDEKLAEVAARIESRPTVTATYFNAECGFVMHTGTLRRADLAARQLIFEDGVIVFVDDLLDFFTND